MQIEKKIEIKEKIDYPKSSDTDYCIGTFLLGKKVIGSLLFDKTMHFCILLYAMFSVSEIEQ